MFGGEWEDYADINGKHFDSDRVAVDNYDRDLCGKHFYPCAAPAQFFYQMAAYMVRVGTGRRFLPVNGHGNP